MNARELFKKIRQSRSEIKEARRVTSSDPDATRSFEPGDCYFVAHLNEMFLASSREWYRTYYPVVIVIAEHEYDGKQICSPFIVGPELIKKNFEEVPGGMVFSDTRVAGIHPYNGGSFALTVILLKVVQDDYTRQMLRFIEKASGAFALGEGASAFSSHLKIAEAVLTGVEGLLGMRQSTPVIGQRLVYDHGRELALQPGYFAMIDCDVDSVHWEDYSVEESRLYIKSGAEPKRYRDNDFVLFSVTAEKERSDFRALSYDAEFDKVLKQVVEEDDRAWEKAKAMFMTLYGNLITSPDLTRSQAQLIFLSFKADLLKTKQQRDDLFMLSKAKEIASIGRQAEGGLDANGPDDAAAILDL